MKILVVGNGGREHALAWTLTQSETVQQVICTPGNGGTATLTKCQNRNIPVEDIPAIVALAKDEAIDLVVVGPEVPLALGIADELTKNHVKVFGPGREGAKLEASKSWAKDLMLAAGVPTATGAVFTDPQAAKDYITQVPIVIKADGLAAGKGVIVATSLEMADSAITSISQGEFGQDNCQIVIEEFLPGQEVSVLAITDGKTLRPLIPAQDHKPIGEGDTGPNTGGMGAYAPTPLVSDTLMVKIQREVLEPTLQELQNRGIDYCGIIYAGLMITPDGDLRVLEFNCRFGDPETQAGLLMLETPLDQILTACCDRRLAELPPIRWKPGVSLCVVLASCGYPGTYPKGKLITGIDAASALGAKVFHAGTRLVDGQIITDGGRVLGVTAIGDTVETAITNAYQAVDCINFDGMYCRRDIGFRLRQSQN
ncbi:phosphoribosylamine--glycine ligase [Arthrospira sp. O9.13F]|nr:phosphoribosylamine--glycine ligase [Arthrospira sp. O9.13F]